ncbi:hypothetical protein [Paraglaciecola hydrolytica]|nr:hypothetical protein [Paraglaciecola hydrolytica]
MKESEFSNYVKQSFNGIQLMELNKLQFTLNSYSYVPSEIIADTAELVAGDHVLANSWQQVLTSLFPNS